MTKIDVASPDSSACRSETRVSRTPIDSVLPDLQGCGTGAKNAHSLVEGIQAEEPADSLGACKGQPGSEVVDGRAWKGLPRRSTCKLAILHPNELGWRRVIPPVAASRIAVNSRRNCSAIPKIVSVRPEGSIGVPDSLQVARQRTTVAWRGPISPHSSPRNV
jgi:hypothetical protein